MKAPTYKKVVEFLIVQKSKQWIEELLTENNIGYKFISIKSKVEFEREKDDPNIYWTSQIDICFDCGFKTIYVGGTADDFIGISESVIWDSEQREILWMANETTRKNLGISQFKI